MGLYVVGLENLASRCDVSVVAWSYCTYWDI